MSNKHKARQAAPQPQVAVERQGYTQSVELMYAPLTAAEHAAGKEAEIIGGFIPVLTPMVLIAKMSELINQMALDLSSDPEAKCPEPEKEMVDQMYKSIQDRVAAGGLPPEALHVLPAFQIKYQMNSHNLLVSLLQMAAGAVVRQYKAKNMVQEYPAFPPVAAGPARPGSAIMLAKR